jgi:hypothetical protein
MARNDQSRLDLSARYGCTRTGSTQRFRVGLALVFAANHLLSHYRAHIVGKVAVFVYRDVVRNGPAGFRCVLQLDSADIERL